jgi:acid phosphatase family membrane protein YuiD
MTLGVSAYFIAAALAFGAAQAIKYLLNRFAGGDGGWRQLYMSGRMPSGHTATMTALTTVVGVRDGVDSGLFAVVAVMTLITAYDAMMSRRSSGEQGVALRKLLAKSPFAKDPLPYVALGHRPLEVAVGGVLGLVIGFAVVFFMTI